jgi:hypothetical protein
LGITAIHVQTGEPGIGTKILHIVTAIATLTTGPKKPGYSHPITFREAIRSRSAFFYRGYYLMTGNNRQTWQSEIPFNCMQVSMANAAH